ncbi:MAG: hypothetical protein ACYCW6_01555 [Candidatus Xenobia bacterium]
MWLDDVLAAYGGEARWRQARRIEAAVSARGYALTERNLAAFQKMQVGVELSRPRVSMRAQEMGDVVGVMDGARVELRTASGTVSSERRDRASDRPFGDDPLDQVWFWGMLLWTALALPALLLRRDVAWHEVEPGVADATFPRSLPPHCRHQRFYFSPQTSLVHRHDFTTAAFPETPDVADAVTAHGLSDGLPYPAARILQPRHADGSLAPMPVLLRINVEAWKLT